MERNLVGQMQEPLPHYDLLGVVMIGLGQPEEAARGSLLRLLAVLLSDRLSVEQKRQILEEEFDLPMTEKLEEELTEMCDLSQGIWKRGLAEGEARTIASSIKNLMETMNLTVEQAMDALKVPPAERAKYAKLL